MEVSMQPLRMTHSVPYPALRSTLGFAERLDDSGVVESSSFAARSAASAGLMFGGGTFAILLFLLAMVGLSEGQSVFQSQTTPFFARDTLKRLSGRPQVTAKSIGRPPMVYHNEQTVAVVALGPKKTLLDCELIEAYNLEEKMEVLRNLSRLRPLPVTFEQMMELISKCQELSEQESNTNSATRGPRTLTESNKETPEQLRARSIDAAGALTLFQGIMPGTKWCGTGDLATTYYDLGPDVELDMCCRSHDLCPVKVRAFTSRFNLTNYSIYSKSHCECDEMFYNCLKRTSNPNAVMIGNFYFNLLRVPCIGKQVYEKQSTPVSNDMQFKINKLTF